jgi:hypothetical protein
MTGVEDFFRVGPYRPYGIRSLLWSDPTLPRRAFACRRSAAGLLIVALVISITASAAPVEPTVEELKAKVASASTVDRAHLCVQIAQKQLVATDKFYASGEIEKAQATLTDVVAFSELARDYSIQTHKYQKQTEIGVRSMARKLADIKHLVAHEDQEPIQDAMNRLQRVRDDLLAAMFPKGVK